MEPISVYSNLNIRGVFCVLLTYLADKQKLQKAATEMKERLMASGQTATRRFDFVSFSHLPCMGRPRQLRITWRLKAMPSALADIVSVLRPSWCAWHQPQRFVTRLIGFSLQEQGRWTLITWYNRALFGGRCGESSIWSLEDSCAHRES